MERLLVFADFDWLDKPELVGELCYEKLRGSESYAFRFDDNWLKFHAGIMRELYDKERSGRKHHSPGSGGCGRMGEFSCSASNTSKRSDDV